MMSFLIASFILVSSTASDRSQNADFWIAQLQGSSVDLQINALQKLAEIRSPKSLSAMAQSINSSNSQVRYQTAVALSKVPDKRSLDLLAGRSRIEKDVYVRAEINRSIQKLKEFFESGVSKTEEPSDEAEE